MWKIIIMLAILLSGCGQQGVFIYREHVTQAELNNMCDRSTQFINCMGWNEIVETNEIKICHIYVLDPYLYPDESCYHECLGHETRHCLEGAFHGESNSFACRMSIR